MELTIRVDRQGRAVLPREVRIMLGIDGETELVCRIVGKRLVLEKFDAASVQRAFAELEDIAPSLELDAVKVEGEDKYFDREYALRKIGV
ncbi:MAG: AbrB/MazE/SpoVT family DNA-binding domain-containing protein [Candidatus Bathyarchaeia archaeon]